VAEVYSVPEPEPWTDVDVVNVRWKQGVNIGLLSHIEYGNNNINRLRHKYVRLQDLGRQLLVATEGTTTLDTTSWTNLLAVAGVAIGVSTAFKVVIYVQAPQVRAFVSSRRPSEPTKIQTPYLAWIGVWNIAGRLVSNSLLCSATSILTLETEVCAWPFGNGYESGKVCWGEVQVNVIPERIQTLSTLFFESRFNRDLWRGPDRVSALLHSTPASADPDLIVDLGLHLGGLTTKPLQTWIMYE
jgi:hypothetical protein